MHASNAAFRPLAWLLAASVSLGAVHAQTTWHVDVAASPPGDGSAQAPFTTIQAGIDASAAGDHVLVAPGEYVENVVAPDKALHIESAAGPLQTVWRAAAPGPALRSFAHSFGSTSTLDGFTFTQSDIGLEANLELRVSDCIFRGNGVGVRSHGPFLDRCTITGNGTGVSEAEYGVEMSSSVIWGNESWDYFNFSFSAISFAHDCVGLQKVTGLSFSTHVLVADPLLWNPAAGDVHLQPGSPCIGFAAGSDVGALPFDPAWGKDFVDVGGALAGTGTPMLSAAGLMLVGHPIGFLIDGGTPGGAAVLVIGLSSIAAPFKGGTLVPHPDLLIPLALNGSGKLALGFTWPAGVPSGAAVWSQVWLPDAQGPQGYAASNGLKITTP
jgi:hypothetical protein